MEYMNSNNNNNKINNSRFLKVQETKQKQRDLGEKSIYKGGEGK